MKNLSEISGRLNDALKELAYRGIIDEPNANSLAAKMKRNPANTSSALNGNEKYLTDGFLKEFFNTFEIVSKDYINSGVGSIIIEPINESINEYEVPLLPISATGGTLSGFEVQVMGSDCEKVISPIKDVDFAITVTGESMAPEYPSGSRVLIKKIQEKIFIDWGRTYVLDTINGIVIKNIFPGENGNIICRSINKDFPDFEIDLNDDVVFGVYRVLLCLSLK